MSKKNDLLKTEIESSLPRVFLATQLRKKLEEIQSSFGLSDSAKLKFFKNAKKIAMRWSRPPHISLMTFSNEIEPLDVVFGLCSEGTKYYLSDYSALYWNELVDQRPGPYYVSAEAKGHRAIHTVEYNEDIVKQAFMKSPRHTSYSFKIKGCEVYIVEKQNLNRMGLISKRSHSSGLAVEFEMTGIERSLVDAVFSPHYCGGIVNVVSCFRKAIINMRDLYDIYEIYNPFYPYWQTIGLILEKTKGLEVSRDWTTFFKDKAMKPFYLDRNFRSDWKFSETWKIFYPPGLFDD